MEDDDNDPGNEIVHDSSETRSKIILEAIILLVGSFGTFVNDSKIQKILYVGIIDSFHVAV